jgi:hypothetical protein
VLTCDFELLSVSGVEKMQVLVFIIVLMRDCSCGFGFREEVEGEEGFFLPVVVQQGSTSVCSAQLWFHDVT